MAFAGMQPLGGLLIGILSQYIGTPNTLMTEGIAAIIIALIFMPFLRKDILKEKDKLALLELEDPSATLND
jgi:MFS-type transporter involved in bile tolerance (Atg22 family)